MLKLYRHQQVALAYLRACNFFALFMEQGTGKTIPTLCRALDLLKLKQVNNVLVVAPKSTLGAWQRDIELFELEDQSILNDGICLINYDKVWRGSQYEKTWDVIILDEAHWIKNRSSRRSQFLLKRAVDAKYRYILTGTPISNGQLENIWSLYTFLDPYIERGRVASRIFEGSYPKFLDRYCVLNQYYTPKSYLNVSELQKKINRYSYRVLKDECLDLPEKLPDEILDVELKEKQLYREILKDSASVEYDVLAENPLTRALKLRQICSGHMGIDDKIVDLKADKIKVLDEFLDGWNKKLVIFANFKYSIASICKLLKKKKFRYVTLDGEQKDKQVWRQFQKDPKIQIIVCQYASACAGIDLFASDTILYYEPTIKAIELDQSRDRIHRTGQKNKCSYIHMITKGSIEHAIYTTVRGYSDFSEKLFKEYMEQYVKSYLK